jgi:hypothetical protein
MSGGRASERGLRELLARVRERLSQARSVDPESRKHLSAAVHDIDHALADGGPQGVSDTAGAHASRLESLAVRFEADHPGLAEVIREVIDALARVGI